ncbi:MAG: PKD domain-containing protein [Bacteroidia bacterium]|nr:PKD domain-containing protein [Bacteroidia bacterium]MDW8333689.1 PKD domain-containing protein [Bacteroidia bacterium]
MEMELRRPRFRRRQRRLSTTPSPTYAQPGVYDVELIVETVNGCSDTVREKVRVGSLPMADFAVRSALCAGEAAEFEDRSTANVAPVVGYHWDFGVSGTNNDTAVGPRPQFVFPTPGDYTVRLTITTSSGCRAVVSRTLRVAPRPQAAIATDTLQCAGQGFVLETAADGDAQIWEFGTNGYFSTLKNPFWRYDSAGTYNVSLTVLTESGCVQRQEIRIHVLPSPTLDVTTSQTVGREPFTVRFDIRADDTLQFRLDDTLFVPKLDTTETGITFDITLKASGRDTVVRKLEITAGNEPCAAHRIVPITVYPPLDSIWDVAVENFSPRIGADGFLSVISRFRNQGNVPIYYFDAGIRYGSVTVARQIMNEDTLMPGDALERFFNLRLAVNPHMPEKFACVEAHLPNGRPDSRPEDNIVCKALEESLAVHKIYPNPARDRLFVSFVSPVNETIPIEVFDAPGRKIFDLAFAARIGLNEAELDLSRIADGMYTLVLTFRNQRERFKFVVDK